MYNIGNEEQNIAAYMRDLPIRKKIQRGEFPSNIETGQQRKHIPGTLEYQQYVEKLSKKNEFGPSRITITDEELDAIAQKFKGTGILKGKYVNGSWIGTETITINEKAIGTVVNNVTGAESETSVFKIHYGTRGIHIVPDYPSKKGAKAKS